MDTGARKCINTQSITKFIQGKEKVEFSGTLPWATVLILHKGLILEALVLILGMSVTKNLLEEDLVKNVQYSVT